MKNILTLEQAKQMYDIIMESAGSGGYSAYDSVAEMKADTDLKDGDYAITTGYYSYGDGGGGEYAITSSTAYADDGLLIALDNGLKAELIVRNNTINAKQYGCKIDGTTDDTARANLFFAKISNASTDKMYRLYVPKGTMYVTGTIQIWYAYSGWYNSEIDFDNTIIMYDGTASCIMHVNEANRLTIRGLTVRTKTDNSYVRITSAQNVTLEHCRMGEIKLGGFEDSIETSKVVCYLTFNDCEFSHVVLEQITSGQYMNCLYFNECHIFAGDLTEQLYDYCFEMHRYANSVTFTNCDISYPKKALFLMDEENTGGGIISLNGCYLDSDTPITDANPDSLSYQINIFNCFSGDNIILPNRVMSTRNYCRTFSIGNLSHGANIVSTYAKNTLLNGDLWNVQLFSAEHKDKTYSIPYGIRLETDSTHIWPDLEIVDYENAPNGKALRATFLKSSELEDGYYQQFTYTSRTPSLTGQYSVGCRVIKRSENVTGTLEMCIVRNDHTKMYRHYEFANMDVGEEYICCMDIGRDPEDYVTPTTSTFYIGFSTRDVTDVAPVVDIVEVSCNFGITWIPGLKSESPLMLSCTTETRPVPAKAGFTTFDTTIGKHILWDGTEWCIQANANDVTDVSDDLTEEAERAKSVEAELSKSVETLESNVLMYEVDDEEQLVVPTMDEVEELVETKLSIPTSGLEVGKYFKISSITDGVPTLECCDIDMPDGEILTATKVGDAKYVVVLSSVTQYGKLVLVSLTVNVVTPEETAWHTMLSGLPDPLYTGEMIASAAPRAISGNPVRFMVKDTTLVMAGGTASGTWKGYYDFTYTYIAK